MTFCSFYCVVQLQWDLVYYKSFHKEILFIAFFQQWHSWLTSRDIEITLYFVPLHSRVYKIILFRAGDEFTYTELFNRQNFFLGAMMLLMCFFNTLIFFFFQANYT